MVDGVVWLPTNSKDCSIRRASAPMPVAASRHEGWCGMSLGLTAYGVAAALPMTENPTADFSDTPLWLALVKAVGIFVYLLISTLLVIWFERRVIGRMQQRPGPNRNGPFGLLQTLADGMKSMLKEDITPASGREAHLHPGAAHHRDDGLRLVRDHPARRHRVDVRPPDAAAGHRRPGRRAARARRRLASASTASSSPAGAPGSTYPLLGGLRSTAQVITYEIAMGLSLVAIFLYSGSMSTSAIVSAQSSLWYILPAFFSFAVYVITMVGETNRLPFDLAEGEGELTGGFHTEYSSMRFAMFFLGEYVNMFTVSALATTLFLGGWQAPPFISAINDNMFSGGWWGLLWFTAKLWLFMFVFVWLRGSLPRVRYDQFMRFGWKFLIPITLAWVVAVAFIRGAQLGFLGDSKLTFAGRELSVATVVIVSIVAVIALAAAWIWDDKRAARAAAEDETPPEEIDPFEDGYPVPPLPGQRLAEPTRAPAARPRPRARARRPPQHPGTSTAVKEEDHG